MKGIKLSKTGWLILSAGVFVVILAGLGVTRSQQISEQSRMNEELSLSETRLNNLDVTDLRRQLEELNLQVEEGQTQLNESKERLRQTVVSVDVTEEFFDIATYSDVTIKNITTSKISPNEMEGIGLEKISLAAQVKGEFEDIVDFVINLNNGYATGHVQTVQMNIPLEESMPEEPEEGEEEEGEEEEIEEPSEEETTVTIQMIVFSYEGN